MKFKSFLVVFAIVGIAGGAFAKEGTSSGGGGELLKDSQNPWFVQNTARVFYCIKTNPDNFHQSLPVIRAQIKKAIDFWTEEFKRAYTPPNYNGLRPSRFVHVATQEFIEKPCSPEIDLTFQFGTLTGEQIAEIKDVSRTIGVAIRTDYDRVNLRGKGYVYLAADTGPLKPSGRNLVANPWTIGGGQLIYLALAHELGHVFGVPHMEGRYSIMGAGFLEWLMNSLNGTAAADDQMGASHLFLFDPAEDLTTISVGIDPQNLQNNAPVVRRFFGIGSKYVNLVYKFEGFKLQVYGHYGQDGMGDLIGEAVFDRKPVFVHHSEIVRLWLPDEQNVFEPDDTDQPTEGSLVGPMTTSQYFTGTYKPVSGGPERKIGFSTEGGWLEQLFGVMDGDIAINLLDVPGDPKSARLH